MDIEALVTGLDQDHALVKVSENPAGCGRCGEPGGCSTGYLTQIFRRQSCQIFRLPNTVGAQEGDQVMVSVADGVTSRIALAVYLVPVLLVILGAWLGTTAAVDSDGLALFGGGAGLLLSFVFIAWFKRHQAAQPLSQPMITRLLPRTVRLHR